MLQSILAKAFDLKGDFAICYRLYDVSGHEIYMPLLSDWDLDAAFLKYVISLKIFTKNRFRHNHFLIAFCKRNRITQLFILQIILYERNFI